MKKHIFIIALLFPIISFGQFSETLLNKIRYATDDFYIAKDTLNIIGSNTLPCLQVMINGKGPYRFLIDLGSNVLNFKQSVVAETGMEIIVDRESGDIAVARKLHIGNSVFINAHGAVYENLDVDGFLGFNSGERKSFALSIAPIKPL